MIKDVLITPLKIINLENGPVLKGLKKSDEGFDCFGEAYFSMCNYMAVKAWKLHTRMTLNLIVPIGEILFVLYDCRKKSQSYNKLDEIILSKKSYSRLTIPPNVWLGFQGLSKHQNLLLNIANLEHDPSEVKRKDLTEIKYSWR
tara:strand:- start:355 stop:786 length:432 start_codon:yes stop_codon:yes gene_type:complete